MTHKNIFLLFLFCSSLLWAEPSAFELQSGATKNDISSLQSSSKNLQNIATDLQNRFTSLEQTQDGFKSLIEGQNLTIKKFTDSFFALQRSFDELKAGNQTFDGRLKQGYAQIDELKAQLLSQQEDIKKLQASLQELNRVMTESNNSIIQQLTLMSQFLEKTQKIQALSEEEEKAQKAKEEKEKQEKTIKLKKSNKENFNDAKDLIYKKDYKNAEYVLNELIKQDYKSAESYFMLGDIAYRKKDYEYAVEYYKKSATLDENAVYMPVLLWRTAWSFRYLSDQENYQKFIDLLIRLYPDSEQGKKALSNKEKDSDKNDIKNQKKSDKSTKSN